MAHPKPNIIAPAASNGQYQHFVPQFLLKNFANRVPKAPKTPKGTSKPKYEKGMFPGDLVINSLDMTQDSAVFIEKPVSRILGQINMYDDFTKPDKERRHVEKLLSKLEAQAAQIITKVTKALEAKEPTVRLMWDERSLLRKFLFLMRYRNIGFYKRFHHENAAEYSDQDREQLREYMTENPQFKTPMDVWLNNIKTIVELEIDPDFKWAREIGKHMYPDDAQWFLYNLQCNTMAFCVPSNPEDEFILTDNSYTVSDEVQVFARNVRSDRIETLARAPFHEFAPVSPKLMIVLRSHFLSEPLEDNMPGIKARREAKRASAFEGFGPVQSVLEDLPVGKPHNSHLKLVGNLLCLREGEDGRQRREHSYLFHFFSVESRHVHTINSILLDKCINCTSIIFNSKDAFGKTLEWYLTAPLEYGKTLIGENADLREKILMKLEAVSRSLGSKKETEWTRVNNCHVAADHEYSRRVDQQVRKNFNKVLSGKKAPTPPDINSFEGISAVIDEVMKQPGATHDGGPPGFNPRTQYRMLGGSIHTAHKDKEQAILMMTLRIKIDHWSRGVDEEIRHHNRQILIAEYLRMPARRLWSYMHIVRYMYLSDTYFIPIRLKPEQPEDAVIYAKDLFQPDRLTSLIYKAFTYDIECRKFPHIDIWGELTPDSKNTALMKVLAFEVQGTESILNCGIPTIENLAASLVSQTPFVGMALGIWSRNPRNPNYHPTPSPDFESNLDAALDLFDILHRTELALRVICRTRFLGIMESERVRHGLTPKTLQDLHKVFFTAVYPTPPDDWRYRLW
ncbi:hypothetical protein SMACR_00790 [Sordaria macrospora]|uniref:WGS project CABT00000000 data, contig 2.2 n=2 Tax=Sordaria macrospora TaxID=5147 RepID=F7VN30_SORMK|nr:uncharacterized protein SMAC_00790 [Sordaria macrospora k-hell]KAA8634728.1 hypothetical protein SMACR_00790 [Sordaria macrospora]WPJ61782.1 hypothetical protein SMAC4_00790 [Sordaria macrospora]CCC06759.1 unnamed protein product [Sordaria macrospora k-hell]